MAVHLFLLLPKVCLNEASEIGCGDLYRDLNEKNTEELNSCISELSTLEKYLAAERELYTYYDGSVLRELSEYTDAFRAEFPSVEMDLLMNMLVLPGNLRSADWREERVSNDSFSVYVNQGLITDDMLSEIYCRVVKGCLPEPLPVNMAGIKKDALYCRLAEGEPKEAFKLKLMPMKAPDVIISMKDVRYPRREYCHNPKHDKANGYISGLSCTKQKAEYLLHVGIGEKNNPCLLWAYDDETDTYTAYRCEDKNGEGIRWHAYTPSPENDEKRKNMQSEFLSFVKNVALKYGDQES